MSFNYLKNDNVILENIYNCVTELLICYAILNEIPYKNFSNYIYEFADQYTLEMDKNFEKRLEEELPVSKQDLLVKFRTLKYTDKKEIIMNIANSYLYLEECKFFSKYEFITSVLIGLLIPLLSLSILFKIDLGVIYNLLLPSMILLLCLINHLLTSKCRIATDYLFDTLEKRVN